MHDRVLRLPLDPFSPPQLAGGGGRKHTIYSKSKIRIKMKKFTQKLVATLMCLSMSLPLQANPCITDKMGEPCEPCATPICCASTAPQCCDLPTCAIDPCFADNCVKPKRKIDPLLWGLVGAAVVGAAAGAGTGYAAGHSRGNKHCGNYASPCAQNSCSSGGSCAKTVQGSVLSFSNDEVTILINNPLPADQLFKATATMFVVTPNGCTVYGPSIDSSNSQAVQIFLAGSLSVSVCNATCGVYQSGVLIETNAPTTITFETSPFTNSLVVNSNCPVSTTSLPFIQYFAPAVLTEQPNQQTFVFDFPAYNFSPDCCVVTPSCTCKAGSCNCR